jgi:glycosyltransferase involved in cell wall biosynthesis
MPPVRTGISTYSAELVAALGAGHQIDVYPEHTAHDFIWTHQRAPYDVVIYQLGNSSHHDYLWPYLFRYPGIAVLHDAHLHHARAAALLRLGRSSDYRDEFEANHPDAPPDAAELAVRGFDNYLHYAWPMTALVVARSRSSAVHSSLAADTLRNAAPAAQIFTIRLPHGERISGTRVHHARSRVRAIHGIAPDAVVFGVFGGLTPEKRLPQVLAAVSATRAYVPEIHLLLGGAAAGHYDLCEDIRSRRLEGCVTLAGYLEDDSDFTDHVAACDVSLNLRWPTAREVSGPWIRALAAGIPTVTIDLSHLADVPSLDPRTWRPPPGMAHADRQPVTVAVDILDEDHSLRLAMRRLASDADLRRRLADAGVEYWQRHHALEGALDDYNVLIEATMATPRSPEHVIGRELPAHLVDSADRKLLELLAPFGLDRAPWSKL